MEKANFLPIKMTFHLNNQISDKMEKPTCLHFPSTNQAAIYYNAAVMRTLTPIDISNLPDLLRIAEEVQTTKTPRILKRDREPVAMLMPVGTAIKLEKKPAPTKADYEASLAAIGSWSDLDTNAVIAHVYRAREEGSRPATRP